MFKLREAANDIVGILESLKNEEHITATELPEVLSEVFDGIDNINLYPGYPDDECFEFALFISLQESAFLKKGRSRIKHLSCSQAMEKVVQHMLGNCINSTQTALFITDNWDVSAYEKWKGNLLQIKKNAHFQTYLKVVDNAILVL